MSSKKGNTSSPARSVGQSAVDFVLHKRLQKCWEEDIKWENIPDNIEKVMNIFIRNCINVHTYK